ncbi:MAG TPA: hypothetical protein VLI88_07130 [Patescibacteria group bacterium]|nr:hypothetical protein [Patescibacteria group bacterium]
MTKLDRVIRRFGGAVALAALLTSAAACGAIQGESVRIAAEPAAAHNAAAGNNWISADSQYGVAGAADGQAVIAPCDSTCLVP